MHLFLKVALLLSSILLVSGCRISKYNHRNCDKISLTKDLITPVFKPNSTLRYNATIDVLKNHLTGLIIVKQTDSITKHIVFVTELGMKMFDFELKNNEINTAYVFNPLNKPKLIEALKRNFSNMFLFNEEEKNGIECYKNGKRFFFVSNNKFKWAYSGIFNDNHNLDLEFQETFHNNKRTSKISYIYNTSTQSYTHIKCKQYGLIKFYFELTEIQK